MNMKNPCRELNMQNKSWKVNFKPSMATRPNIHVHPNRIEKMMAIFVFDFLLRRVLVAYEDGRPKDNIVIMRTIKLPRSITLIGER